MVESLMFKKLIVSPILILLLIGCSSGGSTPSDISSTAVTTEKSVAESSSENSEVTPVSQELSRDTVLAVNRCIESSDSAIFSLDFNFSVGQIDSSDAAVVKKEMNFAIEDCEEAALQAKTDEVRPLIASIDDFLLSIRFAYSYVLLLDIDLLLGKNVAWDESETDSVSDAAVQFLKSVSEYGITSN